MVQPPIVPNRTGSSGLGPPKKSHHMPVEADLGPLNCAADVSLPDLPNHQVNPHNPTTGTLEIHDPISL